MTDREFFNFMCKNILAGINLQEIERQQLQQWARSGTLYKHMRYRATG